MFLFTYIYASSHIMTSEEFVLNYYFSASSACSFQILAIIQVMIILFTGALNSSMLVFQNHVLSFLIISKYSSFLLLKVLITFSTHSLKALLIILSSDEILTPSCTTHSIEKYREHITSEESDCGIDVGGSDFWTAYISYLIGGVAFALSISVHLL